MCKQAPKWHISVEELAVISMFNIVLPELIGYCELEMEKTLEEIKKYCNEGINNKLDAINKLDSK